MPRLVQVLPAILLVAYLYLLSADSVVRSIAIGLALSGHIAVIGERQVAFSGRPAAFGPLAPPMRRGNESLVAPLIFLADRGCSNPTADVKGSIVVVLRGECEFYRKVWEMQNAGARGVIVGNYDNSEPFTMFAPHFPEAITIPSMMVGRSTYDQLANYDLVSMSRVGDQMALLTSFVMFIFSPIFSLVVFYLLITFHRQQSRRRQKASLVTVDALPVRQWGGHPTAMAETSLLLFPYVPHCVICLEDFTPQSRVLTLPCGHEYDEACIRRWLLTQRKTCPICKREV